VDEDQIDFIDVLGRPAKRIKIVPAADTDSITIRLNNRVTIPQYYGNGGAELGSRMPESQTVVSRGAHHAAYVLTGETQYYTEEGVSIEFLEISAMTGGPCTVYCW
jgi:hypothetical protein